MTTSPDPFAGAVPRLYDEYLVPLIFEPYAVDLADRAARFCPADVLEIAAGTGVLTRRMAERMPLSIRIVATDLNHGMLDHAAAAGACRPIIWQQADAMQLPFPDGSFDLVVCQFGAMFFPDKAVAFAEARRVLRPQGRLLFNVWDSLAHNAFAAIVHETLATEFQDAPPDFLARIPYAYHEPGRIAADIAAGGFSAPMELVTLPAVGSAPANQVAMAFCRATPLAGEINALQPGCLPAATEAVAAAIRRKFGNDPAEAPMQAHVITVMR